jgi:hypothetical protein
MGIFETYCSLCGGPTELPNLNYDEFLSESKKTEMVI